jgi:putative membrane-bound dehydrogenase-like protein
MAIGIFAGVLGAEWLGKETSPGVESDRASAAARNPLTGLTEINKSLPSGFRATVYARSVTYPTTVTADPQGNVYVGTLEPDHKSGKVYVYSDGNGDGILERKTLFWGPTTAITGLYIRGADVYVASRGKVSVLRDTNGDFVADSRRNIVTGLPYSKQHPVHANNGLTMGPDGWLYFGMGATCNACIESNRLNATVVRCNPDDGVCEVFARGLRNVYDVAFHPKDKNLFGADNGAESIGGAFVEVEDEINVIAKNGDYGWPFCWGKNKGLECNGTVAALAEIGPHAAPAELAFYTGSMFPPEYRDNLFVALWGNAGRSVIRVVLSRHDGGYSAKISDFVHLSRPVDVATAPDGSLLVADTNAGRIYRITYEGGQGEPPDAMAR